jgi:glyoxylase-like metal-dependent hydrolase (beta-lactamase superfamily II)
MADLPTRQIQIIRHIETHYGKGWFINHMVLTHADNDHATGLVSVLKHFSVKNLWMNRPWLYAAEVLHHFHGSSPES